MSDLFSETQQSKNSSTHRKQTHQKVSKEPMNREEHKQDPRELADDKRVPPELHAAWRVRVYCRPKLDSKYEKVEE